MSTLPHGRGSTGTTTEKDWGVNSKKQNRKWGRMQMRNTTEEQQG